MTYRDFPAGGLADRGRQWLAAGSPDGPAPRLAATVQLLRDGADGVEVFCLERVASMAFAPSMLVFPGGGVDPRDGDVPMSPDWPERLGLCQRPEHVGADEHPLPDADTDRTARSVVAAACRELFEECGILLASPLTDLPGSGGWFPTAAHRPPSQWPVLYGSRMHRERAALVAGDITLSDVLDATRFGPAGERLPRRGSILRDDLLVPVARWVTPHFEARRYDTFFFRASLPAGQEPDGATTEAVSARWVRPADALTALDRSEVRMLPPTIASMEDLARYSTAAEALAAEEPVSLVAPELVDTPGGLVIRVEPW